MCLTLHVGPGVQLKIFKPVKSDSPREKAYKQSSSLSESGMVHCPLSGSSAALAPGGHVPSTLVTVAAEDQLSTALWAGLESSECHSVCTTLQQLQ